MPECAPHQVACREIQIRGRRDDHRVLAARLREQGQIGAPRPEERSRLPRTGQNDPIDALVSDELPSEFALLDIYEGEHVTGHPGVP